MFNRINKKEEVVQSQSCDIAGMTGTWWNNLHSWSTTVDGRKVNKQAGNYNGGGKVHRGVVGMCRA